MPPRTRLRIRVGMARIWFQRVQRRRRALLLTAPVAALASILLLVGMPATTPNATTLSPEAARVYATHQHIMARVAVDAIQKTATRSKTRQLRKDPI